MPIAIVIPRPGPLPDSRVAFAVVGGGSRSVRGHRLRARSPAHGRTLYAGRAVSIPGMEGDPEPLDPPIHVDWIDPAVLADGLPGRLGLTILPGKRGTSIRYPGRSIGATPGDLERLHGTGIGLLALRSRIASSTAGLIRRSWPMPPRPVSWCGASPSRMETHRRPWTVSTPCSTRSPDSGHLGRGGGLYGGVGVLRDDRGLRPRGGSRRP